MNKGIVNATLLKPLLSMVGRNKLSILIYHRVHAKVDPLMPNEVEESTFDWQMEIVSKTFDVLPLLEAVHFLKRNRLPKASLAITFDDGYADNATVALPILKKYRLPATFFISTGFLDGGIMWNDSILETIRSIPNGKIDLSGISLGEYYLDSWKEKRECAQSLITELKHLPQNERQTKTDQITLMAKSDIPGDLMMTSDQVRLLTESGMDIGGHTVSHPILKMLDDEDAKAEIMAGKIKLEEITGKTVNLFAYPNGKPNQDFLHQHTKMVRECGYTGAVTTHWGVSEKGIDIYQLRRFTPWDRTPEKFMLRLLRNYFVNR